MSAEGAWCPRLMGAFDPQGLEDMFSPGPLFCVSCSMQFCAGYRNRKTPGKYLQTAPYFPCKHIQGMVEEKNEIMYKGTEYRIGAQFIATEQSEC